MKVLFAQAEKRSFRVTMSTALANTPLTWQTLPATCEDMFHMANEVGVHSHFVANVSVCEHL